MELFRDNEKKFHKLIHEFAQIPEPSPQKSKKINTSITPENLKIMRAFNRYVKIFLKYGSVYNEGNITPDLQNNLDKLRFAVRYNLEQTNEKLDRMLKPTEKAVKDCGVDEKHIPEDLLQTIYENFNIFLQHTSFYGYRSLYCGRMT